MAASPLLSQHNSALSSTTSSKQSARQTTFWRAAIPASPAQALARSTTPQALVVPSARPLALPLAPGHPHHRRQHTALLAPPMALNTGSAGFGMGDVFGLLARAVEAFMLILTVRVLLSWFKNVNWGYEPLRLLRSWTDPALDSCRGIIPPIGGIDISPLLLFFALAFAAKQLRVLAAHS